MEKNLIINPLLVSKLERINSPISTHLLDLHETGKEIEGLSINYLGISSENPSFISYLNEDRYEKIKNTNKRAITDFTYSFKDSAFYPIDLNWNNLPSDFIDNTLHHREDGDFPKYKPVSNDGRELIGEYNFSNPIEYLEGPETNLQEVFEQAFIRSVSNTGVNISLWPSGFNYHFINTRCVVSPERFFSYINILEINTEKVDNLDFYNPKLRYHSSIGKLLKKIIPEAESLYGQKELANFMTLFKTESYKELGDDNEFIFEEVVGERLVWAYHQVNYYNYGNTLGSSCMRYSYCQDYLEIYKENPDKISLAILLKENKVAARALVWRIDDNVWYDRIYSTDHDTEIVLRTKLDSLGMNNCYDEDYELFVPLDYTHFSSYPYMDTFRYLVYGKGLYSYSSVTYDKTLDDADGNYNTCCACCEDTDVEVHVVSYGLYRDEELCTECGVFLRDGHFVHKEIAVFCEDSEEYEDRSNVVCLRDNTYALTTDATVAEDGYYYLTRTIADDCIEFEGKWYPLDHPKVHYCGNKYLHVDSDEYNDYLLEEEDKELKELEEEDEIEEVELQENKTNDEQIKENQEISSITEVTEVTTTQENSTGELDDFDYLF